MRREDTRANGIVGTIVGFQGSWGGGLAALALRADDGLVHYIPCDNGPTVRALAAAFGEEVIGVGHIINMQVLRGKRVRALYDEIGLTLGGFEIA